MFGFIIAVAAGFFTPQLQTSAAPIVAKALSVLNISETEYDALGVLLAVIIAAVVTTVIGSGNALTVAVGVTIGYFATRLLRIVQDATSGKPKS